MKYEIHYSTKHLISVDYFLVRLYLYISIIHSYERSQDLVCQFLSFISNSMTAFNNQQYRRFSSIFGVEYGVGKRPLTGSMSVVGIRNQSLIVGYVRRLDLLTASLKPDSFRNHRRLDLLLLV